jgi:hypothetical protein
MSKRQLSDWDKDYTDSIDSIPQVFKLNKDDSNYSSPLQVAGRPELAQLIKDFSTNPKNSLTEEEMIHYGLNFSSWSKEYDDLNVEFVPQNRWVHECIQPPIKISDDTYLINMSSDIFIKKQIPFQKNDKNKTIEYIKDVYTLHPVSRTLYQHTEDVSNDENIRSVPDNYINQVFNWIIRWLPNNSCTLEFYTDEKIENTTYVKTDRVIIEYNEEETEIKVPFFMNIKLYETSPVIRHDSPILYMKVIKK